MLTQCFIKRPILASVLSFLLLLCGAIAVWKLPITEYPEVAPPTIMVTAKYPGANPSVVAQTVSVPLEQAMSGVDHKLYMESQATMDGSMKLTITFTPGTALDNAMSQVQSSIERVKSQLPKEVVRQGVKAYKSMPDYITVVHLLSPRKSMTGCI